MRDYRKMAWLSWLAYYKNRWGKDWDGENWMTVEDAKIEWQIYLTEKREERNIRDWFGQVSADAQYDGELDEKVFVKNWLEQQYGNSI